MGQGNPSKPLRGGHRIRTPNCLCHLLCRRGPQKPLSTRYSPLAESSPTLLRRGSASCRARKKPSASGWSLAEAAPMPKPVSQPSGVTLQSSERPWKKPKREQRPLSVHSARCGSRRRLVRAGRGTGRRRGPVSDAAPAGARTASGRAKKGTAGAAESLRSGRSLARFGIGRVARTGRA